MSRGRMKGAILLSRGVENVFRIPLWKRSFRRFFKDTEFLPSLIPELIESLRASVVVIDPVGIRLYVYI